MREALQVFGGSGVGKTELHALGVLGVGTWGPSSELGSVTRSSDSAECRADQTHLHLLLLRPSSNFLQ